jgi:biotin carboxyl carrier protein
MAVRLRAFIGEDETHEVEVHGRGHLFEVTVDGVTQTIDVRKLESDFYSLLLDGRSYEVSVEGDDEEFEVRHGAFMRRVRLQDPLRAASSAALDTRGRAVVAAVMPGRVVRLLVEEGDEVAKGQGLLVLEAMKMENEVTAPRDGVVTALRVRQGDKAESGEELAVVE